LGATSKRELALVMVVNGAVLLFSVQAQVAIKHMIQKLIAELIGRSGNYE
jgi:hypothetical protein